MRTQTLTLVGILALCTAVLGSNLQRPTFAVTPFHSGKQATPNEPLSYVFNDGTTKIQYNVVQSPSYLLDTDEKVIAMTCTGNTMAVITEPDYVWNLNKGTILVGSREWNCKDEDGRLGVPFYRSVVSMPEPVKSGQTLIYTITTAPASLSDCFMDGSNVTFESTSLPAGLNNSVPRASTTVSRSFGYNYNAATGRANGPIPFWTHNNDSLACTNCYVDLDLYMSLGLTIGRKDIVVPYLKTFNSSIGGIFSHAVEVTLDAKASSSSGSGSKVVATVPLPGFRFFIGFIPAWIDVSVPITAGYSFSAHAAVNAVAGYDVQVAHAIGLNYTGDWKPWASETFTENYRAPVLTRKASVNAEAFMEASLEMEFYGAAGVSFNLKPDFSSDLVFPGGCPNPQIHVDAGYGVVGTVDAVLTKPIHKESPSFTLFKYNKPLFDACA